MSASDHADNLGFPCRITTEVLWFHPPTSLASGRISFGNKGHSFPVVIFFILI